MKHLTENPYINKFSEEWKAAFYLKRNPGMYPFKQMSMDNEYLAYLQGLIHILREDIQQMKGEEDFRAGLLHEYYHALLLIQELSAEAGLSLQDIDLTDIIAPGNPYLQTSKPITLKGAKALLCKLVEGIKQRAEETRQQQPANELFKQGRLQACYRLLSIMQEQAELSFGISLRSIGLERLELSDFA